MRKKVILEDDIAEVATLYARSRGLSLSRAIGELILRGTRKTARIKFVDGLPVFDLPREKQPITQERVKAFDVADR